MTSPAPLARRPWRTTLPIALAIALGGALVMPGVSNAQVGASWISRSLPTSPVDLAAKPWTVIGYGGGTFVAMSECYGQGVNNCVMTSPDGITWTAVNDADANNAIWYSIAYGGGRFVAVGQCTGSINCIATSTDGGATWTPPNTLPGTLNAQVWSSITYGGGRFVAISQSNYLSPTADRVMTSTDGLTWTAHSAAPGFSAWKGITFGGGTFVAVASNVGLQQAITSTDGGATWTPQTITQKIWQAVTWGGPAGQERFVAVSQESAGVSRAATSPDGITWTAQAAAANNDWYSIAFGSDVFVAVSLANKGTIANRVMTSPDGISWTARPAAENNNWQSLAYGGGRFVAVAGSGTHRVMTSVVAPAIPATPTATPGDASATVGVTEGGGAGDPALTYLITASPGGATCTATPPATSCTVTGLTNGVAYTFSATATNSAGSSAASPASAPATPEAPAPAPTPARQETASGSGSGGSGSGTSPATPATLAVTGAAGSNQAASATITSRVVVSGAGRVRQVGTRAGRGANAAVLCTAARKTPRAGTYRMTCMLGAAARAELERRSIRVRLATTFRPASGAAVTRTQTVVLKRIPAPKVPVTG